jgi:hypothetical protein
MESSVSSISLACFEFVVFICPMSWICPLYLILKVPPVWLIYFCIYNQYILLKRASSSDIIITITSMKLVMYSLYAAVLC